ncbi:MAG: S-formylglutathione hydrolase [Alphaproteobacteria bacterium]|nr:S-formylglutathione hydrolase [Alphaproteobacteria bacterium]
MPLTTRSEHRSFGGVQGFYEHASTSTGTPMRFSLYLPPQVQQGRVPVVLWLSGLTCTEETFAIKAGGQRVAAQLGLALLAPDTSPRGPEVATDPAGSWDLGLGAGFWLDATQAPWRAHYQMARYVLDELPALVEAHFPVDTSRTGICGHSMGGHGALVLAQRRPKQFRSVSAFAPICHPLDCPWGHKALPAYLGDDRAAWEAWDATALLRAKGPSGHGAWLVDQGLADGFLATQLRPEALEAAASAVDQPLHLRRHAGYDHGYYFIASFLEDHLRHHAAALT